MHSLISLLVLPLAFSALILQQVESRSLNDQPIQVGQINKPKSGTISATLQVTNPTTSRTQPPNVINHQTRAHQMHQQASGQAAHHYQQVHSNNVNNKFLQQASRLQQPINDFAQHQASHHHNHHHQNQNSIVCQITNSKCSNQVEANFNRSALIDFQKKLDFTSLDLRQLLKTYLEEFKYLSLDLVYVARNNTLTKLASTYYSTPYLSGDIFNTYPSYHSATERLFQAIYSHLNNYETNVLSIQDYDMSLPNVMSLIKSGSTTESTPSFLNDQQPNTIANINHEIASYFKQLYLVQLKRVIDLKLKSSGRVDMECLSKNLPSQQQVEQILNELYSQIPQDQQDTQAINSQNNLFKSSQSSQQLSLDQMKLTQSIKQSLEFARTLLSSLTLADEMFTNLTNKSTDWMPHSVCHQALARMTLCPQCYHNQKLNALNRTHASFGRPVLLGSSQSNEILPPPCENYCLNVVRGCMNDIYELNRFWAEHVNALAKFQINMIQMNNIENVMTNLDEKLISFMLRLNQQYNFTTLGETSLNSHGPSIINLEQQQTTLSKISKLCFKPMNQNQNADSASLLLRSAASLQKFNYHLSHPPARLGGSGSAGFMATTNQLQQHQRYQHQQQLNRFGSLASKSRLSPKMSLFNRLEEFVTQLQTSRNFFADWPHQLCHKIRQDSQAHSGLPVASGNSVCWNGKDFSGYNKPLIPFGQAITSSHPEISMQQTDPYNQMVLNFVAKLKDIGAQLARKATRSSSNLYHNFGFDALASMANQFKSIETPNQLAAASGPAGDQSGKLALAQVSGSGSNQRNLVDQIDSISAGVSPATLLSSSLEILSAASKQSDDPTLTGPLIDDQVGDESSLSAAAGGHDNSGHEESANEESTGNESGTVRGAEDEAASQEGEEEDGEEESEQAEVKCSTDDCIDLFANTSTVVSAPTSADSSLINQNSNELLSNVISTPMSEQIEPESTGPAEQAFGATLAQRPILQSTQTTLGGYQNGARFPPAYEPTMTSSATPIGTSTTLNNELYGPLNQYTEFVQTKQNSSSSSLFDVYNVGLAILFQMIIVVLIIIRRTLKRPQILVV